MDKCEAIATPTDSLPPRQAPVFPSIIPPQWRFSYRLQDGGFKPIEPAQLAAGYPPVQPSIHREMEIQSISQGTGRKQSDTVQGMVQVDGLKTASRVKSSSNDHHSQKLSPVKGTSSSDTTRSTTPHVRIIEPTEQMTSMMISNGGNNTIANPFARTAKTEQDAAHLIESSAGESNLCSIETVKNESTVGSSTCNLPSEDTTLSSTNRYVILPGGVFAKPQDIYVESLPDGAGRHSTGCIAMRLDNVLMRYDALDKHYYRLKEENKQLKRLICSLEQATAEPTS